MACHFTGIYDVNRSTTLVDDDYSLVKDWADAVTALRLTGIIFHNNFSAATCSQFESDYIKLIRVSYDPVYNPNVYRYFIYHNFLKQFADNLSGVFITDVSDVVVLNNPFIQPAFVNNPMAVFCGDEPKCLDNEWMKDHATHLRNGIIGYAAYEEEFKSASLLNCGVIGGTALLMQELLDQLCSIHLHYNRNNPTAYTGDMGAFNFLVRTRYNDRLVHGYPVNTIFKAYEHERTDCWFRHK
jgi:hypothetical protein